METKLKIRVKYETNEDTKGVYDERNSFVITQLGDIRSFVCESDVLIEYIDNEYKSLEPLILINGEYLTVEEIEKRVAQRKCSCPEKK